MGGGFPSGSANPEIALLIQNTAPTYFASSSPQPWIISSSYNTCHHCSQGYDWLSETYRYPPHMFVVVGDIQTSTSIPSWRLTGQLWLFSACWLYDIVPNYGSNSKLLIEVGGKQGHAPRRKSCFIKSSRRRQFLWQEWGKSGHPRYRGTTRIQTGQMMMFCMYVLYVDCTISSLAMGQIVSS